MHFSFWRQTIAFTVFFCVAMLAFCLRHHGETIPECEESNSTVANMTAMPGQDTLTAFTLPTYDTGTVELSVNGSREYDSLSGGFTDFPGNYYLSIFNLHTFRKKKNCAEKLI